MHPRLHLFEVRLGPQRRRGDHCGALFELLRTRKGLVERQVPASIALQ